MLYLHATPSTLYERTKRSKHRPLLHAADPFGRLKELYAMRDALYRETADVVIESDQDQVGRGWRNDSSSNCALRRGHDACTR